MTNSSMDCFNHQLIADTRSASQNSISFVSIRSEAVYIDCSQSKYIHKTVCIFVNALVEISYADIFLR